MGQILITLCLMFVLTTTAFAEAYQCKDKDGGMVVRSVPCADYDEFKRTGIMPKHAVTEDKTTAQNGWKGNGKSILNHDATFCTSQKLFDRLASLVEDKTAFAKLYDAAVANYQCIAAYKGQKLYLVDTHLFSGLAEVRYPGSPQVWWTNYEYAVP